MIIAYRFFTILFYPLIIFLIFIRKIINKEDSFRYKEKIFSSCFNVKRNYSSKLIWFHAASVGEFKSILPLITKLSQDNSDFEFLVTTVTLSSGNLAKEEFEKFKNVHHRYFPVDVSFLIKEFLILWKPKAIFLVDSEIWPNLILISNELNIPIALINARITAKSFKRWLIFQNQAKKIFKIFKLCLTSNRETKDYLIKLDSRNVFYNGNIKFINNTSIKNELNLHKDFLINNKFWLAASTHRGEEDFILKAHLVIKKKIPELITIIAPRHIERANEIKNLCTKYRISSQFLNKDQLINANSDVIIINTLGDLPFFFKYAKSVFLGKSLLSKFKNAGGQNPIEAAKFGCKIYHGRYVYNFEEVYELFKKKNISNMIFNSDNLAKNVIMDLSIKEKDVGQYSQILDELSKKTLDNTMNSINNFLSNEIN